MRLPAQVGGSTRKGGGVHCSPPSACNSWSQMGELNQRQQRRRSGKGRGEDRQAANTVLEKDATLWSRTVEGGQWHRPKRVKQSHRRSETHLHDSVCVTQRLRVCVCVLSVLIFDEEEEEELLHQPPPPPPPPRPAKLVSNLSSSSSSSNVFHSWWTRLDRAAAEE